MTAENQLPTLCFRLNERIFGISATDAHMIVGRQDLTPLPRCPDYILGVFGYWGRAVALLDLVRFLKLKKNEIEPAEGDQISNRVVIARAAEMTIGLAVQSVLGVVKLSIPEEQSKRFSDEGRLFEFTKYEYVKEDQIISVLDMTRLLHEARI